MTGGRSGRFTAGDRVSVRAQYPPGHTRTPLYVRGKTGVVERRCAAYPNPEELAYGRDGFPARPVYQVRFRQGDLWPDYGGAAGDVVVVELYEHWLEPA